MATTTPTVDLSTAKYEELKAELDKRKGERITELVHSITQFEVDLEEMKAELALLDGKPAPKRKIKNLSKVGKQINKATRKKGGMTAKEAILAVLKKGPSSSKDIVKATGLKSGSVSQALNLLKTVDKSIKHDGKKGGLWSLK